ncbi:ash family protein [Buttiauxella selenatireducens]|uniref:Ash family protein n=1 Tax=Buttiauxella selenatireducens TaxID=3073902 RepID=A0ABY9SDR8_9ENTR|nr:ash family protein [Buttiauxella sp. R73]WMY75335.1 ash family protein [Buttiauxella sp. R73]
MSVNVSAHLLYEQFKTVLTTSMVAQAGQPSGWPVSL